MSINMNNKLKIYARETKEGKEIDQTQTISISSPNYKRIDNNNQHQYQSQTINQNTHQHFNHFNPFKSTPSKLRASKQNNSSIDQSKMESMYSYMKDKAMAHNRLKELNKSSNSISHQTKLTLKTEANLPRRDHNNKSKTPIKNCSKSKEKVEASISCIISLKDKISQLNAQIDLYDEEHNTIISLGEGALNDLRKENEDLKREYEMHKENYQLKHQKERDMIKKKKESIALFLKQIEESDIKYKEHKDNCHLKKNELENRMHNICYTKSSYIQNIRDLDSQILVLDSQLKQEESLINVNKRKRDKVKYNDTKDNEEGINNKDYPNEDHVINYKVQDEVKPNPDLISKDQVIAISFLLRILCSVYSMTLETILDNTFVEEEGNNKITLESICDNLLSLMDSVNSFNQQLLFQFFTTIINETSSSDQQKTINIDIIKQHFSSLIGTINSFYSNKPALNAKLNTLLAPKKEDITQYIKSIDTSNSGFITFNDFNMLLTHFEYNLQLDNQVLEYIIYVMKLDSNSEWNITQLNYDALLNCIINTTNEKPIVKKESSKKMSNELGLDDFVKVMKEYLHNDNDNTIEDFLSPFEYLIMKSDDIEYLDTKLFNTYLQTKNVLKEGQVLLPDTDSRHNITAIKELLSKQEYTFA